MRSKGNVTTSLELARAIRDGKERDVTSMTVRAAAVVMANALEEVLMRNVNVIWGGKATHATSRGALMRVHCTGCVAMVRACVFQAMQETIVKSSACPTARIVESVNPLGSVLVRPHSVALGAKMRALITAVTTGTVTLMVHAPVTGTGSLRLAIKRYCVPTIVHPTGFANLAHVIAMRAGPCMAKLGTQSTLPSRLKIAACLRVPMTATTGALVHLAAADAVASLDMKARDVAVLKDAVAMAFAQRA